MKFLITVLIGVVLIQANGSEAQVFKALHNFGSQSPDGADSLSDLVLSSNTLYGTTASGGTNYNGTIFKINTDGTGYKILISLTNGSPEGGGMVLLGDTLYGTTYTGGTAENGSIFKINTNGTGFSTLYSFSATTPSVLGTNSDGNRPETDLITDGTALYGATGLGGANNNGTLFKINTNGSGFTVIKTFAPTYVGTNNVGLAAKISAGTNLDGSRPIGSMVINGNTLYGTTSHGGTSNGVVFSVQTDGTAYTVLKYFSNINGVGLGTNSDGACPIAGLTFDGTTLYGVTVGGGVYANGNVFRITTNGGGFTDLHDFTRGDGASPRNSLVLDGSTLYGTTAIGGSSNYGTIFTVQTNGSDYAVLHNFNSIAGLQTDGKLVVSSNILCGTTADGGIYSRGVIFGLTVLPQILNDNRLGVKNNHFGFNINGISNQTAIIEDCTNPNSSAWTPLQTNFLTGFPQYFSDPNIIQAETYYQIYSP